MLKHTGGVNVKKTQKSKMGWLWENMKGYRVLYVTAILGTVVYNVMQLTVPFVTIPDRG